MRKRELTTKLISIENLPGSTLHVALTFDAERDYGSRGRGRSTGANIQNFLEIAAKLPACTVFIEGSFVADYAEGLRAAQERGIEIGLHGYEHELWGPAQWYLREKPTSPERRAALLDRALEDFKRSGVQRPVCFRAPNLVSDSTTLRLLAARGFAVDSSQASHRGVVPVPIFSDGLTSLPVSVDPAPQLTWKAVLPYYHFVVFNFETLTQLSKEQLFYHLSRVVALQKSLSFPPHLVFLAHSWEFTKASREQRESLEASPFALLQEFIRTLTENYRANFLKLSTLAEALHARRTRRSQP